MTNALHSIMLDSNRRKIEQWLEAPDASTNLAHARDLRHEGTGFWLLNDPIFQMWSSGVYQHLWLHGIPGCGKTVLSAMVVDHLAKENNHVILSFFFDFNERTKQTKSGLLRSIALQLYLGGFDSAGHLQRAFQAQVDKDKEPANGDETSDEEEPTDYDEPADTKKSTNTKKLPKTERLSQNRKLTTATVERVVRDVLSTQKKVFIIIDALDESTTKDEIISWIRDMFFRRESRHVQMLYTSREEAEFIHTFPRLIGDRCCLALDREAVDIDVRAYVVSRVQSDPDFTRKMLSKHLLEQIHDRVGNGASGM